MTYEEQQAILERNKYSQNNTPVGSLISMGVVMPMIDNFTTSGLSKSFSYNAQFSLMNEALSKSYGNYHLFGSKFFGNMINKATHWKHGSMNTSGNHFNYVSPNSRLSSDFRLLKEKANFIEEEVKINNNMSLDGDFMNTGFGFSLRKESDALQAIRVLVGETGSGGVENADILNFFKKSSDVSVRPQLKETQRILDSWNANIERVKPGFDRFVDNPGTVFENFKKTIGSQRSSFVSNQETGSLRFSTSGPVNFGNDFRDWKLKKAFERARDRVAQDVPELEKELANFKVGNFTRENIKDDVLNFIQANYLEKELTADSMQNFGNALQKAGKGYYDDFVKNVADNLLKSDLQHHVTSDTKKMIKSPQIIKDIQEKAVGTLNKEIQKQSNILKEAIHNPEIYTKQKQLMQDLYNKRNIVQELNSFGDDIFKESIKSSQQNFAETVAGSLTKKNAFEKFFSNDVVRVITGSGTNSLGNVLNIAGAVVGTVASIRQENAIENYIQTALTRGYSDDKSFFNNLASQHSFEAHILHSQNDLEQLSRILNNRNTSNELRSEISPLYESILGNYQFEGIKEFETS